MSAHQPPAADNRYDSWYYVLPGTNVHSQYPSTNKSNVSGDSEESTPPVIYDLVRVPRGFTVNPPPHSGPTPIQLTYNYNILKGVAGIIQILSGSFVLYQVSQRQLSRLGYASYSLTVVPYILMSILNLLATSCERQYPSMFLVIYRGLGPKPLVANYRPVAAVGSMSLYGYASYSLIVVLDKFMSYLNPLAASSLFPVTHRGSGPEPLVADYRPVAADGLMSSEDIAALINEPTGGPETASDLLEADVIGAVGEAYGDLGDRRVTPTRSLNVNPTLLALSIVIGGLCCIAAPYIIIYLLTGFRASDSTRSQRAWLMAWLVIGHVYGFTQAGEFYKGRNSWDDRFAVLFTIIFTGTAAIGGFVVVGQMIMNDALCTVL